MKHSKPIFRLVLIAILIVPFILRERDNRFEPYPAILLPSWGEKVSTEKGFVTFSNAELLVIFDDGSERIINPKLFFRRIPDDFWSFIAGNQFGLAGREFKKNFRLGPWKVTFTNKHEISPAQRRETLDWIHEQLIRLELNHAQTLRFRWVEIVFDVKKGIEVKRKVTQQRDVILDQ